jgi:hypothetical protein
MYTIIQQQLCEQLGMPPHIYVQLKTTIMAQSVALNKSQQASSSSKAASAIQLTALPTTAYESDTQQVNIIHYSYISIVYIISCNQRLSLQFCAS